MVLVCREALPLYTRVRIHRAGEREGLWAKVIDRVQTVGGYVLELEFEPMKEKQGTIAVAQK